MNNLATSSRDIKLCIYMTVLYEHYNTYCRSPLLLAIDQTKVQKLKKINYSVKTGYYQLGLNHNQSNQHHKQDQWQVDHIIM